MFWPYECVGAPLQDVSTVNCQRRVQKKPLTSNLRVPEGCWHRMRHTVRPAARAGSRLLVAGRSCPAGAEDRTRVGRRTDLVAAGSLDRSRTALAGRTEAGCCSLGEGNRNCLTYCPGKLKKTLRQDSAAG